MYILPWTSEIAILGNPLRKCKPSQFCETICLSIPTRYNSERAMWVKVGSA